LRKTFQSNDTGIYKMTA